MTNCLNCKTEIEQIEGKKSRIFCSDKCRMAHNRTLKSEQPKANKSNPNTEKTDKSEQPVKRKPGECQYCGHQCKPEEGYGSMWNIVETCYDCVASRNNIKRDRYPKHEIYAKT